MKASKLLIAVACIALVVAAVPKNSDARTRTGSDLGSRVAALEATIGALNTLLENVSRSGNDLIINSGLTVEGPGDLGPTGSHIVRFRNTDGGGEDGIAVKINRAPCNSGNNFCTFYNDDDYVCGRVEGFALLEGDPATSFPSVPSIGLDDFFVFCPNFISVTGGRLPGLSGGRLPSFSCDISIDPPSISCDVDFGALPTLDPGAFPSIDFKAPLSITNPLDAGGDIIQWLADVICWCFENDLESLIQTDPFGLALAPLILAESTLCKNGTTGEGGVTYGSTGADYAEWLEKQNPSDRFVPGQVVGVHRGKISKKTDGAEKVMPISLAPIVVGNMPPKERESAYAKVGFMGQVPVYVRGKVRKGDYVVASGKNDGIAIGVSPEALELVHVSQIIGRAWSASDVDGVSAVNVAIGLKTSACVDICKRQEAEIDELEEALDALLDARHGAKGGAR